MKFAAKVATLNMDINKCGTSGAFDIFVKSLQSNFKH